MEPSERRQVGNGRRVTDFLSDRWAHQVVAIALILSTIYAIAAWGVPLVSIPRRVDEIERAQPALLFMTCILYRDAHPGQLPAVCETVITTAAR